MLSSGLLQDGNIRVGIFPGIKKIFIGGVSLGCVALLFVGTSEPEMGERSDRLVEDKAGPLKNLVKFGGGSSARCPAPASGPLPAAKYALART